MLSQLTLSSQVKHNCRHEDRLHARYGGSSVYRWSVCPGSVRLCELLPPRPSSEWALEGTAAHEYLEGALRAMFLGGPQNWHVAPKEVEIGEDFNSSVQVVIAYVSDILDEYPDAVLLVEQQFEIPSNIAPGQVFGTNDACVYVPSMRLLYVLDYKHGAGVPVEVKGNKQCRFYAVGALTNNLSWVVDTVVLVIIQPRAYHPDGPEREEWLTLDEICDFAAQIDPWIAATLSPDAPLVPGEVQCRFCPAAAVCPAREKQTLAVIGPQFADVCEVVPRTMPALESLPVERIAAILNAKKTIEDWLDSVEKEAIKLVAAGQQVPGWKLVEAWGRRRWEGEPQIVAAQLSCLTNERVARETFLPPTLVGITEAEKLLKDDARTAAPKGKVKEAVSEVTKQMAFLTTKKSSGNLSLVPEDNSRPAFMRVGTAFGDVLQISHGEIGEQT